MEIPICLPIRLVTGLQAVNHRLGTMIMRVLPNYGVFRAGSWFIVRVVQTAIPLLEMSQQRRWVLTCWVSVSAEIKMACQLVEGTGTDFDESRRRSHVPV